jgi:pyrroline-5-carboxylate reductase
MVDPSRELWLIGAGRMGLALSKGWAAAGLVTRAGPVHVIEPKPTPELQHLVDAGAARLGKPPYPPADGRFLVLAVKPQLLPGVLAEIAPLAAHGAGVLSIVAGRTIEFIRAGLGAPPELAIVRAMPNTPAAIGRGISALYAGSEAGAGERATAEKLLAAVGATVWVEREGLIDSATAISGNGPAYFYLMVEALAEAGVSVGLPRDAADKLARETLIGSGALLAASAETPAALRQAVTSPGGTTEAALKVLMATPGLADLMRRTAQAAVARAAELAKG